MEQTSKFVPLSRICQKPNNMDKKTVISLQKGFIHNTANGLEQIRRSGGKNVMVGISRINQSRRADFCYKGCEVGFNGKMSAVD